MAKVLKSTNSKKYKKDRKIKVSTIVKLNFIQVIWNIKNKIKNFFSGL